jgi:hypothetical protein
VLVRLQAIVILNYWIVLGSFRDVVIFQIQYEIAMVSRNWSVMLIELAEHFIHIVKSWEHT